MRGKRGGIISCRVAMVGEPPEVKFGWGGERFASSREGQGNGGQGKRERRRSAAKEKGGGSPAPVLGRPEMGNRGGGAGLTEDASSRGSWFPFFFLVRRSSCG